MTRRLALAVSAITLAMGINATTPRLVQALPALQLYIENSSYSTVTESWEFTGNDVRLWVIGDIGDYGTIYSVKLTAVFPATETGTISLMPTTATPSLLPAPGDPSISDREASTPAIDLPLPVERPASALSSSGACGTNGTIGTIPCRGDMRPLANHGEYGSGMKWVEFLLGDLTKTDSPVGDYILTVPDPSRPSDFPKRGQINAYDLSLSGFTPGTEIHFDAFDHDIVGMHKLKYVFAPFSHDATLEAGGSPPPPPPPPISVPEPSSFLMLGLGAAGLIAWGLRRNAG